MVAGPAGQAVGAHGISRGRQSKVQVLRFQLSRGAEFVIWKQMGLGKGLTHDEANEMHGQLRPYRRSLRNHGWNIPKILHSHVNHADEEFDIWSYEQYITGGDADHLIADKNAPDYAKWHVLRTAVETLSEYETESLNPIWVDGLRFTALPHGLDLKLANLVSDGTQVWFVDLFGPKLLSQPMRESNPTDAYFEEACWANYTRKIDLLSRKNLFLVTATREGSIARLVRLAEQSWTESGGISTEEFRASCRDIFSESLLPAVEQQFLREILDSNYAWLDSVYSEVEV